MFLCSLSLSIGRASSTERHESLSNESADSPAFRKNTIPLRAVGRRKPSRTPNAPTICHNLLMCGRYRLSRRKQMVEEYFGTVSGEDDWTPRYNIAPTQLVPIIRQNPKEPIREL